MRKCLLSLFLLCLVANSYAIQVSVRASSPAVSALGFQVNGKKYGGMGKSYSKSGLPSGSYQFGVRINGVFGTDVPCLAKGKKAISLSKDTNAILNYSNNRCTVQVN